MKINCDFPSDTGGDRKQIQWEATFLSEGCMRKEKWNKSGQIEKDRESAALQKNEHTMTKRVRKGEKRPKKKEREGEGDTNYWTEGLPVVRQLSVPHKGELLFECVPSVRACHQVCECVCVCEREWECPTYTLKSWQKLNTVFPSSQRSYWSFCQPLSLTHTQAYPHSYIFSLYIKDLFFSRTFSYIFISADTGWHHKQQ